MNTYPTTARIPLGTLAPKPKEPPKPAVAIPSEDELRSMVSNGMGNIVQTMIDMHKLPWRIEDGKLLDNLPSVELALRKFVTQDETCLQLKDDVRVYSKLPDEVLITGESGTGKETIARALYGDRTGAFIPVNCAGLPSELVESELFGHVAGSFTGATGQKQGMLKAANEGVLFLDEIGELPLNVQGKLLRALQEKKIRMVGSNIEHEITCRFVCATHRNLKQMVKDGLFRLDLYARISTFTLHIPSLAERTGDVEPIIKSLAGGKEYALALTSAGIGFDKIDVSMNVRSLQQFVRRYAVLNRLSYT